MMAVATPTLRLEKSLHREGARYVIGVDEVGRGAIAGPVAVGVAVFDSFQKRMPQGLRDSKLLSEKRREELEPKASRWASWSAVGMVSAADVDEIGIVAALGLAGLRAFEQLPDVDGLHSDSIAILDGSFDWLSRALGTGLTVRTRIKADRDCGSVAAASVLAKVRRDRLMIAEDARIPGYLWASNKGYASREHYAAIHELGPSELHRITWLHKQPEEQPALFDEDSLEAMDALAV